jgi:type VII secretion protein EccB
VATRRDLIQGFQFAARRVVSAVVLRQTDPKEWPFRRLGGAGVGTVMLTVVALGAVGVYGMVFPGGKTSWRDGRSVIVDKRTGASYVYIEGKLHPALNFTSAALLVGSTNTTSTASTSLEGVPRGVPVGIDGVPDSVPTVKDLVTPPWSLCTRQVPDESGTSVSRTRLVVGRRPDQGKRPGESALLVTDTADTTQHLIWHDRRYLLADLNVDRTALGLDSQVNVPVGDAWLKALPAGQQIGLVRLGGAGRASVGQASSAVPGATVGQLFRVGDAGQATQYYLADADSLVPISDLQGRIEQARVQAGGSAVTPLSLGAATAARKAAVPAASDAQPPTQVPQLCASYADDAFAPQILVDSAIPVEAGVPTAGTGPAGVSLADRVWVPPGKAALVKSLESPTSQDGPTYLITDVGRRYALPSEALRALGLDQAKPSRLPASLIVRIPEGPALEPDRAREALQQEGAKQ